ncbi:MAG: sigma-70 family polymerase sigma factor [Paenibacillus sp.]|nr:sigma-70 family polymerase sigma factor [Paenibacillus sp.]
MGSKHNEAKLDERGYLLHIRDLKLSYRATYWILRSSLKKLDENHPDKPMIKEAMSDITYAINWMHTGKQPGNKRGIERRSAYQREKLMDPVRMQSFVARTNAGGVSNLTDDQRYQIEDALCRLSPQERACYEMKHGQGFSFKYIPKLLNIERGTVESYVNRAQKKVSQDLQNSLFLWDGE